MRKTPVRQTQGPLVIYIGLYPDVCVYELLPESRRRIKEKFPQARMIPQVMLGLERKEDFESLHGPYFPIVGHMLTGLTPEQIGQAGGLRICDLAADSIIWEWRAAVTRAL